MPISTKISRVNRASSINVLIVPSELNSLMTFSMYTVSIYSFSFKISFKQWKEYPLFKKQFFNRSKINLYIFDKKKEKPQFSLAHTCRFSWEIFSIQRHIVFFIFTSFFKFFLSDTNIMCVQAKIWNIHKTNKITRDSSGFNSIIVNYI